MSVCVYVCMYVYMYVMYVCMVQLGYRQLICIGHKTTTESRSIAQAILTASM
jgi:hypothetical protein